MTAPTPSAIVQEMIDQLRLLQGSGEYVPLARSVTAGNGLQGGGPLTADVTLSLTASVMDAIGRVQGATWLTADGPVVAPTANTMVQRSSTGTVRTGTASNAADAVPLSRLQSEVADVVRMNSGAPIKVQVVSSATHDESTEISGVLYIIVGS